MTSSKRLVLFTSLRKLDDAAGGHDEERNPLGEDQVLQEDGFRPCAGKTFKRLLVKIIKVAS